MGLVQWNITTYTNVLSWFRKHSECSTVANHLTAAYLVDQLIQDPQTVTGLDPQTVTGLVCSSSVESPLVVVTSQRYNYLAVSLCS